MMATSVWSSSATAFACASSALPRSKRNSGKSAHGLLQEALQKEAKSRAAALNEGIRLYRETSLPARPKAPPSVWRRGTTKLLDYSTLGGLRSDLPPVLFIPSLINRYYILDLEEKRSFARYLTQLGHHVLVVDWDAPGEEEKRFTVADYVTKRLLPAIEFIHDTTGRPPVLAGYCMGGVLALAAENLAANRVSGLALLATPWDFHAKGVLYPRFSDRHRAHFEEWLSQQKEFSPEYILTLFYLADPWLFYHKFSRLTELSPNGQEFQNFVTLEQWVNDGVPLSIPVAHETLIGWAQDNRLARGGWSIGKQHISGKSVQCPTFIALPTHDHVVPRACGMSLREQLPEATYTEPGAGHVGMIVGKRARRELWQPFHEWVEETSAQT